jgi:hypothetical protein
VKVEAAAVQRAERMHSAVYGTLSTAIVLAGEVHESRIALAGSIVFTVVTYAVCHAYADVVGLAASSAWHRTKQLGDEVLQEWPLIVAAAPMLISLVVSAWRGLTLEASAEIALVCATVMLFIWGVLSVPGVSRARQTRAGLFDAGIGVIVILFALWLRH